MTVLRGNKILEFIRGAAACHDVRDLSTAGVFVIALKLKKKMPTLPIVETMKRGRWINKRQEGSYLSVFLLLLNHLDHLLNLFPHSLTAHLIPLYTRVDSVLTPVC